MNAKQVARGSWQSYQLTRLLNGEAINPVRELRGRATRSFAGYQSSLAGLVGRLGEIGYTAEWLPIGPRGGQKLLITACPVSFRHNLCVDCMAYNFQHQRALYCRNTVA